MADQIPPPPPGFQMVQPMGQGVPPPPPGFQMLPHPAMPAATEQPPSSDYSPAEIAAMSPEDQAFLQREQQGAAQLRQAPSIGTQLADAALRTSGNVTKGLGSLIDLPIDLTNRAIEHFGGPQDYFKTVHGLVDKGLASANVPDPTTSTDRVVGRIEQGLGGLVGGMGVGSALAGSGSQAARGVGQALLTQPGAQVAATVAGSGAGGVAHEYGASPRNELLLSLAGGLTPAGLEATAVGASRGAARLLGTADQEASRLASLADLNGIPLKASQISESKVAKLLDSASKQVPFSGGQKFEDAQQAAFNTAVAKTIGENTSKITPQVFEKATQRVGNMYNDLWNRNSLTVSPGLRNGFQRVAQDAVSADPAITSKINGYWQRIGKGVVLDAQGRPVLPGNRFKEIDADMGRDVAKGGDDAHYIGQLQAELRTAMGQGMSAADQAQLALANKQWGNLKTIEALVAKNALGDISPSGLMQRVTANGAGKRAMARGTRGDLGDLARVGSRFLKDPIANSQTAPRSAIYNTMRRMGEGAAGMLATGGAYLHPVAAGVAGAGLAGTVAISRTIQNIVKNPRLVEAILNNPNANAKLKLQLQQALGASVNPTTQSVRLQGQ